MLMCRKIHALQFISRVKQQEFTWAEIQLDNKRVHLTPINPHTSNLGCRFPYWSKLAISSRYSAVASGLRKQLVCTSFSRLVTWSWVSLLRTGVTVWSNVCSSRLKSKVNSFNAGAFFLSRLNKHYVHEAWIRNYVHIKLWYVITYQWPYFSGRLP